MDPRPSAGTVIVQSRTFEYTMPSLTGELGTGDYRVSVQEITESGVVDLQNSLKLLYMDPDYEDTDLRVEYMNAEDQTRVSGNLVLAVVDAIAAEVKARTIGLQDESKVPWGGCSRVSLTFLYAARHNGLSWYASRGYAPAKSEWSQEHEQSLMNGVLDMGAADLLGRFERSAADALAVAQRYGKTEVDVKAFSQEQFFEGLRQRYLAGNSGKNASKVTNFRLLKWLKTTPSGVEEDAVYRALFKAQRELDLLNRCTELLKTLVEDFVIEGRDAEFSLRRLFTAAPDSLLKLSASLATQCDTLFSLLWALRKSCYDEERRKITGFSPY
jgi:hypothetical protein